MYFVRKKLYFVRKATVVSVAGIWNTGKPMSSERTSASAAFLSWIVPPNTVPVSIKFGGMMYMSFSSCRIDILRYTSYIYGYGGQNWDSVPPFVTLYMACRTGQCCPYCRWGGRQLFSWKKTHPPHSRFLHRSPHG